MGLTWSSLLAGTPRTSHTVTAAPDTIPVYKPPAAGGFEVALLTMLQLLVS